MPDNAMRLTEHPRAQRAIQRAKAGAALAVFAIVALLSLRADLTPDEALARALPAGITAYFVAWAAAVTVWRHLAIAELEAAHARRVARIEQAASELSTDNA